MCGFVGILLKEPTGSATGPTDLGGADRLRRVRPWHAGPVDDVLAHLEAVSYQLAGWQGYRLLRNAAAAESLRNSHGQLVQIRHEWERVLAEEEPTGIEFERGNSSLVRLRDIMWRLDTDALGSISAVESLLNPSCSRPPTDELLFSLWQLAYLLRSMDRLEVRGRDSAGLSCLVSFPNERSWREYWARTQRLGLAEQAEQRISKSFTSQAIRVAAETYSLLFTFKVAAEVGEMGQNAQSLRTQVASDLLFHETLASRGIRTNLFAHTRWASNGIVNEANCHPVVDDFRALSGSRPLILSAGLNGDIDNYHELRERLELDGLIASPSVTTDAQVLPLMTRWALSGGAQLRDAFVGTVGRAVGSYAAVLHGTADPDRVLLAHKGGGQAVYVGIIPEGYVYSSEVYGIVELCDRYVSMEGDLGWEVLELTRGDPSWAEIKTTDAERAGAAVGVARVRRAEITTRDIDRAGFPHFLIKEICESPSSMEKTLRGKFSLDGDGHRFHLGHEVVPERLVEALQGGTVRKVYVVGQGTAAVAAEGIAHHMGELLGHRGIDVRSLKASELSGFHLAPDMTDCLVTAVSQSGTTTDTNRTVDMVRERGGWVLAIVNRRNSALVAKAHGVFYTGDGRDVEMAVASTKAFYTQVAAGHVLGLYLAEVLGTLSPTTVRARLKELTSLPAKMGRVLQARDAISRAARQWAPTRCHWAVVGSGPNRVAAEEIRIKLSELCYKSIASDHTEDKKHIDLSSEPLVLVCTAGLEGAALDDLVKEVAIFRAHRACPVVFVSLGEDRFREYADETIVLPAASAREALLLNTLAGHLWGYYSAVAQEEGAGQLRSVRRELVQSLKECEELSLGEEGAVVDRLLERVRGVARHCLDELAHGRFNSSLCAATASRVSVVLHYLAGTVPWVQAERELGSPATLSEMLGKMVGILTVGVEEATRPIDAIKHQAKTVTVGISRLEGKPRGVLFDYLDSVEVSLSHITYSNQLLLRLLGALVGEVAGSTHYALQGLNELGEPVSSSTLRVTRRYGLSEQLRSRAEAASPLRGTKRWVVANRSSFAGVGGRDGRFIAIVPLVVEGQPEELALLHLKLRARAPLHDKLSFLKQYRGRLEAIRDAATELDVPWRDQLLEPFSPEEILGMRAEEMASRIRDVMSADPLEGRAAG